MHTEPDYGSVAAPVLPQMPGLNFIAIDFETANPSRASVLQIGLARVRDGVITHRACSMVLPPAGFRNFHPRNTAVHRLSPRDVVGAPSWPEILIRLKAFAGNLPLVGHNVAFERSVINQASEAEKLPEPYFEYLCSQRLAKIHLPDAPSYRLNLLAEQLALPDFEHHDAGADAVACANLVLAVASRASIHELANLWPDKTAHPTRRRTS